MQLTQHFSMEELCASDTATRKGIDNTPDDLVRANLLVLADGLERVRDVLAVPMHISSAYRSPKLNAAIGSKPTSAHVKGLAADFVAPQFGTPYDIVREIEDHASEIDYDQVIHEGTWVHIAFADEFSTPRREVLTAHFGANGTTYTKGLA